MEVMKQWVEPETVVEEVMEVLHGQRRRQQQQQSPQHDTGAVTNGSGFPNGDYEVGLNISFDFERGGTEERYSTEGIEDLESRSKNSNMQKVISKIMDGEENAEYSQNGKSQGQYTMPLSGGGGGGGGEEADDVKSAVKLIEEMLGEDEEVIELEFERAVKHIGTHTTLYCPNCSSCITKVVLRRKKVVPNETPTPTPTPTDPKPGSELLGCFSCFSLFIPSGDGIRLWPFGKGGKSVRTQTSHQQIPQSQPPAGEIVTPDISNDQVNIVTEEGHCFSLFGIFAPRKSTKGENDEKQKQQKVGVEGVPDQTHDHKVIENLGTIKPHQAEEQHEQPGDVIIDIEGKGEKMPTAEPLIDPVDGIKRLDNLASTLDTLLSPTPAQNVEGGDTCPVEPKHALVTQIVRSPESTEIIQDSKSMEIVKSIVYGGLMESIESLSVVSSAAASGATTLNIIAIGLANLIGGLVVIGHNLWDLKNDCSRVHSHQTNQQVERYKELLGRRDYFLLHATVVVLSFLLFGLIPPITYGFTFRTSDDRDFKLGAVAAASLLCTILLAIGKAYICKPPKFYEYIKTIIYYVVTAIMVSGIAYAVGDLIERVVGNLGWFETSTTVTLPLSEMKSINQALASY